MKSEFFLKPLKLTFLKERETKLDKLEKDEGIRSPNKNTKVYSREREKSQIC